MGRAEPDGDFVIGGHPHAQPVKTVAASNIGQQRKVQRRLLVERWEAHQANHVEANIVDALRDQGVRFPRRQLSSRFMNLRDVVSN